MKRPETPEEAIADFRDIAFRCWAQQDPRRPILSFILRLRARQATRYANRLAALLKETRR